MEQCNLMLSISDIIPALSQEDISEDELDQFFELCREENSIEIASAVAKYKLKQFINDDFDEMSDFHLAAKNGDLFLLRAYALAGIDINRYFSIDGEDYFTHSGTALTLAFHYKNKDCVRFLLQQKEIQIDLIGVISLENSHMIYPVYEQKYIVPFLEMRGTEFEPLLDAIKFDVDVRWGNRNEHNCFIDACERCDVDLLRFALEHGADPNQVDDEECPCEMVWSQLINDYLENKNRNKDKKYLELIDLIIEFGAAMNSYGYGESILNIVWQSKDDWLMRYIGLDNIFDEFYETSKKLLSLEEKQASIERLGCEYVDCFPIKADILSDLLSSQQIPIGYWVKRLVFKQISEDEFSIYIETKRDVTAIELPIPEFFVKDFPRRSAIKMALFLINAPIAWWFALEEAIFKPLNLNILDDSY